jgi:hypothetical protein
MNLRTLEIQITLHQTPPHLKVGGLSTSTRSIYEKKPQTDDQQFQQYQQSERPPLTSLH